MTNTTGAQPTILLVDDDAGIRSALTLLLEAYGLQVRTFDSALTFLQERPPQDHACLILDMHMPGLDGATLQELLEMHHSRLPTIVLTAHPDGALADRARAAGARAVLTKPVSVATLLEEIRGVLPPTG